jgi:copper resistance protein B
VSRLSWLGLLPALAASPALAQMQTNTQEESPYGYFANDEQIYIHGIFNELEGRFNGQNTYLRWDGEAWAGTDENQIWIKSEGRQYGNGKTTDGDQELLYSTPITTFFDLQAGVRYDLDSMPGRGWAALGIQGLGPDFADLEATLYGSDGGHFAAKIYAYYDLFLTQFLIAEPQIELNFYSRADRARLIGSGLSDMDVGLRVRYEITRKFAPYIGIADYRQFSGTAALARENGEHANDLRFVLGLWTWF